MLPIVYSTFLCLYEKVSTSLSLIFKYAPRPISLIASIFGGVLWTAFGILTSVQMSGKIDWDWKYVHIPVWIFVMDAK